MKEEVEARVRGLADALAPLGAKLETLRPGKRAAASKPPHARDGHDDVELELVTLEDGTVDFAVPGAGGHDEHARTSVRMTDLPGNTIHEALGALDRKLTPNQGLRQLGADGALVPATGRFAGRTLLVVHGTFSNSDNVLAGIERGDPEFLRWARQRYSQVLTFDYASLSKRSIANAMGLQRIITGQVDGDVDLVCHSQGGLIARYWLERLEPARLARSKVILVGAPLGGTSLAAPGNLRHALRLLASAATVVGVGAGVVSGLSLLGAATGLAGVIHKVVGLGAIGGLLDAAVALVPGVDSMSRVGTNIELDELRRATTEVPPGYFAITGDYQAAHEAKNSTDAGGKPLKKVGSMALARALDEVFPGAHDLIVDTGSHTELSDTHVIGHHDPGRLHRFGAGDGVHHRSYFSQPSTLEFITRRLG